MSNPLKILWIAALPRSVEKDCLDNVPHGAQGAMSWIVSHLPPPDDVELHIMSLWPGGTSYKSFPFQGATWHLIPCPSKSRAATFFLLDHFWVKSVVDKLKPDAIHGWGTEDSYGLLAIKFAPNTHVVGIQGLINAYRRQAKLPKRTVITALTERWTLKRAKMIVAESQYALCEADIFCSKSVHKQVVEHPLRKEIFEALASDGNYKTALFIGNFEERKGFRDAVSAFAKSAPGGWVLRLIGESSHESFDWLQTHYGPDLESGRITLDGIVGIDTLVHLMQTASVLLLPTRIDTGPTALKEALHMGLWPICYDNSGPAEYIRKFEYGNLVADGEIGALNETIASTLDSQPWNNTTRRENLRQATSKTFSRTSIWANLLSVYRSLQGTNTNRNF